MLDGAERRCIASRIACLARRNFRTSAQDGHGGAELVGRIGHETPHPLHGALDGRSGLTHEHVAATGHEYEGDQGGRDERADQRRVFVLELQTVGHGHRDVRAAVGAHESLGVQPHDVVFGRLEIPGGGADLLRFAGGPPDPRRGGGGPHRGRTRTEQVERPIGDAQLVDRVGDDARRRSLLGRADSRGVNQRGGRGPERSVQLLREALPDREVEAAPQDPDDREKNADVPAGQPPPDTGERIPGPHIRCRTGNRSRAGW